MPTYDFHDLLVIGIMPIDSECDDDGVLADKGDIIRVRSKNRKELLDALKALDGCNQGIFVTGTDSKESRTPRVVFTPKWNQDDVTALVLKTVRAYNRAPAKLLQPNFPAGTTRV